MMASDNKAIILENLDAEIPNIVAGTAAPFKNMPSATRVPVSLNGKPVRAQLSQGWDDALDTRFGIGLVPKFDNPNAPDKYRLTLSMTEDSPKLAILRRVEARIKALAMQPTSLGWFRSWKRELVPMRDKMMNSSVSEPKVDETTGQVRYKDYLFKVNVNTENVSVFKVNPSTGKLNPAAWTDVTPNSKCIAMVALSHLYVTAAAWGATWYLDTVIIKPGTGAALGIGGMQLDGMEIDDTPAPALANAPGGQDMLPDSGLLAGERPTLAPPTTLEDIMNE